MLTFLYKDTVSKYTCFGRSILLVLAIISRFEISSVLLICVYSDDMK